MTVREAALVLGISVREIHSRLSQDRLRSRLLDKTFQVEVPLNEEPAVSPLHIENILKYRAASSATQQAPLPPLPAESRASAEPTGPQERRHRESPRHAATSPQTGTIRAGFGWLLLSTLLFSLIAVGIAQWAFSVINRWQDMPYTR